MSLEQQILETPLLRRVVTQNELNSPCAVYCFIHEVPTSLLSGFGASIIVSLIS